MNVPVDINTPTGAVLEDADLEPVIMESVEHVTDPEADDVAPTDAPDAVEVVR